MPQEQATIMNADQESRKGTVPLVFGKSVIRICFICMKWNLLSYDEDLQIHIIMHRSPRHHKRLSNWLTSFAPIQPSVLVTFMVARFWAATIAQRRTTTPILNLSF